MSVFAFLLGAVGVLWLGDQIRVGRRDRELVVQRDPVPHVRVVPVDRPRSLAQDAYNSHVVDSLAGGTTIEAGFWRAQRSVASDRTFGDQALRRSQR